MGILIVGHARHGKDTVAQMIHEKTGLTFKSSSEMAAEIFLYDALKEKYGYKNFMECFEDRVNHRKEWHDLICEYNKDDKARLAKEIMKRADMYVGMRSKDEIDECVKQGLFDTILCVIDFRKPKESADSLSIDPVEVADYVINNHGDLSFLSRQVDGFIKDRNLDKVRK